MAELVRLPKHLGAVLRRHRRKQNLTQTELAKRAGFRQGTISQVESGLETVKVSTIMCILAALDLELIVQTRTNGSHEDIEAAFT